MSALVEIVEAGLAVTIQDRGRFGYRNMGVPVSGALDPCLMTAANAMLGNDPDAAVLEVCLVGASLKALSGTVRIALAGALTAQVLKPRGRVLKVQSWQTATLFPGDVVRIDGVGRGVAYVGISGGFQVPMQLGSRSTYPRARIGGVEGRALAVGDRLQCDPLIGNPWLEACGTLPWPVAPGPIRVLPGPQDDHFTPEALAALLGTPYRVTRDMDRMGIRLDGEKLTHNDRGAEIVSDGVAPGSIQVPANGRPIVLMADCQTSGGYPKIATVIRADLPRLAHVRPRDEVHFVAVDHAQAAAALREQAQRVGRWCESLGTFRPPGVVDEVALYEGNLISGAIRGDEPAWYSV